MTSAPASARDTIIRSTTEEALGELIRDACAKLQWRFLWLRKTYNSSAGIPDLLLVPLVALDSRHVLHRELKGYRKGGKLGPTSLEQLDVIRDINIAGGDAAVWTPDDWYSGRIEKELLGHWRQVEA